MIQVILCNDNTSKHILMSNYIITHEIHYFRVKRHHNKIIHFKNNRIITKNILRNFRDGKLSNF